MRFLLANDDITDFAEENNGFEHGIIAEASPSSMRGFITAVYAEHGDKKSSSIWAAATSSLATTGL